VDGPAGLHQQRQYNADGPRPVSADAAVNGFRGRANWQQAPGGYWEFQGKNLDQDILMTFSDTIRGGALQGIQGHGVVVMTRENMLVLLKDMGKQDCGEGDCEVETARNIGADYVISGKVVRMEQLYVVTLKLHETKGGSLLGADAAEGSSQVELLGLLREHARQLTTPRSARDWPRGRTRGAAQRRAVVWLRPSDFAIACDRFMASTQAMRFRSPA